LKVRRTERAEGRTSSAGGSTESQLLYHVDGFEIDIRLRPSAKTVALSGRIVPEDGGAVGPERVQAYLHGPDARMASLRVTELGEFSARQVDRGEQTLEVLVDGKVCHRLSFVV
jgi:hypothetical protein